MTTEFKNEGRPKDEGSIDHPRMAEAVLYEDRNGNHIIVVKGEGREYRAHVAYDTRKELGCPRTIEQLGLLVRKLAVRE
jgi:hypothetical protein